MWGQVNYAKELFAYAGGQEIKEMVINENHDVIVDKPSRTKGIFDGCEWKPFVSNRLQISTPIDHFIYDSSYNL